MDVAALQIILQQDAERLAALTPHLPRPERSEARQLTLRVWQALDAQVTEPAQVLALTLELQHTLSPIDAGKPAQPVWQMRTARPLPELLRKTLVADRVAGWQARFDRRWQVRVALSAVRLKWLESRVAERAPTHVATVRQPEEAQNRESLELLHKRGRTRFS